MVEKENNEEIKMKKLILLVVIIGLIGNSLYSTELNKTNKKYEYKIGSKTLDKEFEWNLFYPTYYLYTVFNMIFELDNYMEDKELKAITKTSIKLLSQGYQSHLIIKNYSNLKNLEITMTPRVSPKDKNKFYILIITNYDLKKKKVVSGDGMKNAFANFILLKDDKWIKGSNRFNKDEAINFKEEMKINNLCDMYLYDEIKENDELIEDLLINNIKTTDDIVEKYFSTMTLNEYYLFSGEYEKGKKQIEVGTNLYEEIPKERQKNIKILIRFNNELLEYVQMVRKDEKFWNAKVSELFNLN